MTQSQRDALRIEVARKRYHDAIGTPDERKARMRLMSIITEIRAREVSQ